LRRRRGKGLAADVAKWSESFLGVLTAVPPRPQVADPRAAEPRHHSLHDALAAFIAVPEAAGRQGRLARRNGTSTRRRKPTTGWLVACDFDGTLAPLVADPETSTLTEAARAAIEKVHSLEQAGRVR